MPSFFNVLFICTSNFYRSRFAQAVFNHLAHQEKLRWRAFSRGLCNVKDDIDLSPLTRSALLQRGIHANLAGVLPTELAQKDLSHADMIILLDREEHLPLLSAHFPSWVSRVIAWEELHTDESNSEVELDGIEKKVSQLILDIKNYTETHPLLK